MHPHWYVVSKSSIFLDGNAEPTGCFYGNELTEFGGRCWLVQILSPPMIQGAAIVLICYTIIP
jgi:hypothetical protein